MGEQLTERAYFVVSGPTPSVAMYTVELTRAEIIARLTQGETVRLTRTVTRLVGEWTNRRIVDVSHREIPVDWMTGEPPRWPREVRARIIASWWQDAAQGASLAEFSTSGAIMDMGRMDAAIGAARREATSDGDRAALDWLQVHVHGQGERLGIPMWHEITGWTARDAADVRERFAIAD